MKLKQRIGDFRVRELLDEGCLRPKGDFRLFRVTKRKMTSPDAASALAEAAGVETGDVSMAGLKDRQAITVQYMSVHGGRPVSIQTADLRVEPVGYTDCALGSEHSSGNAFEITVRSLMRHDLDVLRENLPALREHGFPNYFDDQRFGNLRHGQGWIARELMLGRAEQALEAFVAAESLHDDERTGRFKRTVKKEWGDWPACVEAARSYGAHHSIFEHLDRSPGDFAGAFYYATARLRLIHLYAWQSHVWNRAVAELVREQVPLEQRVVLDSVDGALVCYRGAPPAALTASSSFPLPGERLAGVADPGQRAILERVLASEGLEAARFRIEGVPGFQLKGEERALLVTPSHLRVRPAVDDPLNPGMKLVKVRFELPRGAYASLVVRRLLAEEVGRVRARERAERDEPDAPGVRHPSEAGAGADRRGRGGFVSADAREGRSGDGWRGSQRPRGAGSFGRRDERGPRVGADERPRAAGPFGARRERGQGAGGRGDEQPRGARAYGQRDERFGGRADDRSRGAGSYGRPGERGQGAGGRGADGSRGAGSYVRPRERGQGAGGQGADRSREAGSHGQRGERGQGFGGRGDARSRGAGSFGQRGERDQGAGGRGADRSREAGSYGQRGERGQGFGARGDARSRGAGSFGRRSERGQGAGGRGADQSREAGAHGQRGERGQGFGARGDDRSRGAGSFGRRSERGQGAGGRGADRSREAGSHGQRGERGQGFGARGDARSRGAGSFGQRGERDQRAGVRGDDRSRAAGSYGQRDERGARFGGRGDERSRGAGSFGQWDTRGQGGAWRGQRPERALGGPPRGGQWRDRGGAGARGAGEDRTEAGNRNPPQGGARPGDAPGWRGRDERRATGGARGGQAPFGERRGGSGAQRSYDRGRRDSGAGGGKPSIGAGWRGRPEPGSGGRSRSGKRARDARGPRGGGPPGPSSPSSAGASERGPRDDA